MTTRLLAGSASFGAGIVAGAMVAIALGRCSAPPRPRCPTCPPAAPAPDPPHAPPRRGCPAPPAPQAGAPQRAGRPAVSMIAAQEGGAGGSARNALLNFQYQDYPAAACEALLYEAAPRPSKEWQAWARAPLRVPVRYRWYDASAAVGTAQNPGRAGLLAAAAGAAVGDILVVMDPEAYYHSRYLQRVVGAFERDRALAVVSVAPHARAHLHPDGTHTAAADLDNLSGLYCRSARRGEAKMLTAAAVDWESPAALAMPAWEEESGGSAFLLATLQLPPAACTAGLKMAVVEGGRSWLAEQWHELSRPLWLPPLELGTGDGGSLQGPRHMRPRRNAYMSKSPASLWSDWHTAHPEFLRKGNSSRCTTGDPLPGPPRRLLSPPPPATGATTAAFQKERPPAARGDPKQREEKTSTEGREGKIEPQRFSKKAPEKKEKKKKIPLTPEEEGAKFFAFMQLPRPSAAAIAALNGVAPEDAETAEYARSVCGTFSWPLRDLSAAAAPDLYWGLLFDREREIVQVALYEMRGLVKAMVIVESNVTQTGSPRRLLGEGYFAQLAENDPLAPRIVHQVYEEPVLCRGSMAVRCHPPKYGVDLGRERTIRNVGLFAGWKKAGVRPDDIVMMGDADEFVHARFLYALRRCAWNDPQLRPPDANPICSRRPSVGGRIAFFNSHFDCPSKQWYWHPNGITFKCMLNGSEPKFSFRESNESARWTADDLRSAYTRPKPQTMQIAPMIVGWHLRNFFSPEAEQNKYRVYGHPRHEPLHVIQLKRKQDCQTDPWGDRGPASADKRAPVMRTRPGDLPLLVQMYPQRFASFFFHPERFHASPNSSVTLVSASPP
eukprot:TRINITY_DN2658_c2_g4_i2.p1 TRINITY_DN2658_c2_g4~~TRINITY_DN2658_c2_g4_i2.p1  ORF type:complete len:881 (+),score=188.22 TRINITY_DN2658_c2_g4_i2:134-2644(+)